MKSVHQQALAELRALLYDERKRSALAALRAAYLSLWPRWLCVSARVVCACAPGPACGRAKLQPDSHGCSADELNSRVVELEFALSAAEQSLAESRMDAVFY